MCIGIRILLAFQFSKVQGYSKRVGIPFKSAATIAAATFFPVLRIKECYKVIFVKEWMKYFNLTETLAPEDLR